VVDGLRAAGIDDVPVVVGGIIPPDDAAELQKRGVAAVFTPKDFRLTQMMDEIVTLIRDAQGLGRDRP
jgi:(2R)-ethylmalonyl-CoA mutase